MVRQRLILIEDDKTVLDVEGSFVVNVNNDWQEIVTNPAMFAALAGAPPEVTLNLPGETRNWVLFGRDLELRGTGIRPYVEPGG